MLEKLLLVTEMIMQLVVCQIILISKKKNKNKLIAVDLSKQHALDVDPREIQQINFTANLDRDDGETILVNKQKKLFLNFHKEP